MKELPETQIKLQRTLISQNAYQKRKQAPGFPQSLYLKVKDCTHFGFSCSTKIVKQTLIAHMHITGGPITGKDK